MLQASLMLACSVILFSGCSTSTNMHTQTVPDKDYREALQQTDPGNYVLPKDGSDEEAAMLRPFRELFETYTYENVEANLPIVYADKLYFRDAFKQFSEVEPLLNYMLKGFEPLENSEFLINRIINKDGEYYVDWMMRLDFKKTPTGTWEESIGMTHIRFNSEGEVIFHQDYWDPTDIVYRRIPIAKQLIGYVKKKL
jgi:hypothetical protein